MLDLRETSLGALSDSVAGSGTPASDALSAFWKEQGLGCAKEVEDDAHQGVRESLLADAGPHRERLVHMATLRRGQWHCSV